MAEEEEPQFRPIIIDIGSDKFRMGFSGEDYPDIIMPSIYVDVTDFLFEDSETIEGLEDIFITDDIENHLFGNDALKYRDILKIHEFKKENNYQILQKFFQFYYSKLKIDEQNLYLQPIIILGSFTTSELEKNKLKQLFFEIFKFPSMVFLSETQSILSAIQKSSGVIVNIGESETFISSIFHGFTNIMARDIFPVAGKELTNYFLNLILSEKGAGKSLFMDKWFAKEMKEKACLCINNSREEKKRIKEGLTKYNYTIDFPDGSSIEINKERFMTAEALFNPRLVHIDYIGLGQAIVNVINTWDRENREELVSNIILSGGSSLIPGLKERLTSEIQELLPEKLQPKVNIVAPSGRENMAWVGASILYNRNQISKGWIQRANYKGPQTQISEM